MEKKIIKALRTKEGNQINYDLLYTKYSLSKREQEVVSYLLKGWTNKEIAEKLFISQNAIRKHLQNIKKKCGVKNRYQIIKLFQNFY